MKCVSSTFRFSHPQVKGRKIFTQIQYHPFFGEPSSENRLPNGCCRTLLKNLEEKILIYHLIAIDIRGNGII